MSDFTFEGFEPANTTPVPDVLFDELLSELNESELKVLLYIIRRTAGFKKQTDAISLTQFQKGIRKRATGEILDKGCGVKDRATIVKALASLEKIGCIESTKGSDPQGDRATSSYRVRFRSGVVGKTNHPTDMGSGQNQPPWFAKPTTGSGQNQPGVVGDSNPQETVLQSNSLQETEAQEDTLAPAIAAPSAPSSSISPDEDRTPYVPDFNASQEKPPTIQELSPVLDEAIERVEEARVALDTASQEKTVELSTCAATSPHASAKVEHAKPKQGNSSSNVVTTKGNNVPPTAQIKPQLTLLGGQVREWYEIIRATRLRLIANNVKALNELGEMDGMSFENLKETIETIEEQDLVKKKSIPIGLQELSSEEGYWRFDKWYPVVVRNRKQQRNGASRKPSNIDQEIEASRQAMMALDAREKVRAQR